MFVLIKAVQEIRAIQKQFENKPLDVIQSYSQIRKILETLLRYEIITEAACLHHRIKLDFILLTETNPDISHAEKFTQLAKEHCRAYTTIKDIIYTSNVKTDMKSSENKEAGT